MEEEAGYLLQQAGTEFSYGDYEGYDTYKEEAGKKLDEAQNWVFKGLTQALLPFYLKDRIESAGITKHITFLRGET